MLTTMISIIKSRINYNKNLSEQQKERLLTCSPCQYNSDNQKEKTLKVKIMIIINKILDKIFGVEDNDESICTECGCNLKHKSSQPEQNCPKKKWK